MKLVTDPSPVLQYLSSLDGKVTATTYQLIDSRLG